MDLGHDPLKPRVTPERIESWIGDHLDGTGIPDIY
jgi:hypothetical protein